MVVTRIVVGWGFTILRGCCSLISFILNPPNNFLADGTPVSATMQRARGTACNIPRNEGVNSFTISFIELLADRRLSKSDDDVGLVSAAWRSISAIRASKNCAIDLGVADLVVLSMAEQSTPASRHREHDGARASHCTFLVRHLAQAIALRRTRAFENILVER